MLGEGNVINSANSEDISCTFAYQNVMSTN